MNLRSGTALPRLLHAAAQVRAAVHDPLNTRFLYLVETGEEAVLLYRCEGKDVWTMYHTEVPQSQQGKGIGAVLAEAAFKHVKDNGIHVKVTCEYLQHYLKKHPELGDLVIK